MLRIQPWFTFCVGPGPVLDALVRSIAKQRNTYAAAFPVISASCLTDTTGRPHRRPAGHELLATVA